MGGDFNKTDANVVKGRDSCQHPQNPNLPQYSEGRRYNIIKDRDFYLNQSEHFWTSRHNGFFGALQSMIQQSSATGYTHFRVLLPKVIFDSQTNFRYEVENLYHFLKSFLQNRGISFSWRGGGPGEGTTGVAQRRCRSSRSLHGTPQRQRRDAARGLRILAVLAAPCDIVPRRQEGAAEDGRGAGLGGVW